MWQAVVFEIFLHILEEIFQQLVLLRSLLCFNNNFCNRTAYLRPCYNSHISGILSSVGVYVATPFSSPATRPRRVAAWTPNNWICPSQEQLFPEKFEVLVLNDVIFLLVCQVDELFVSIM